MKRLILLILVAAAAWYGYHHYQELRRGGSNQAVLVNHAGKDLARIRLTVPGQTLVVESLDNGATTTLRFRSDDDGVFKIVWQPARSDVEHRWTGGTFAHGPQLTVQKFEFTEDDGVIWTSELLPSK